MNLSDLLDPDRVIPHLRVNDKTHLLEELARQVATRLPVASAAVAAALSAREGLGSTGLGRGFALPHARLAGVKQLFGLFARLVRPIDFEAIDGRPVDLVFLLLIPSGTGSDHVAALAAIAREMRSEETIRELRKLRSAPALYGQLTSQVDGREGGASFRAGSHARF